MIIIGNKSKAICIPVLCETVVDEFRAARRKYMKAKYPKGK
jgi:hypothetical protein